MEQLLHFLTSAEKDNRLTPTHLSLYLALYSTWHRQKCPLIIKIFRKDLMLLAKIASIATYHKKLQQLVSYGYITYRPSYNYHQGSEVAFCTPPVYD